MEFPANIQIVSKKHDGSLHRCWEKNTVLFFDHNHIIGINDATLVTEGNGEQWRTNGPALFYFPRFHWFNMVYILQDEKPYYYCNISSPYHQSRAILQYIDYDIDFIVQQDLTYTIVDEDEYKENKDRFGYSLPLQKNIRHAVDTLQQWIQAKKQPFQEEFTRFWLAQYREMNT